jgi:hypothetical protein
METYRFPRTAKIYKINVIHRFFLEPVFQNHFGVNFMETPGYAIESQTSERDAVDRPSAIIKNTQNLQNKK